jgi:hypothetical protein
MNQQLKPQKYRNKKLTQSAKYESCVSCGANDGTIVWAHSNESFHGKGTGTKAHDLFGAFFCFKCHSSYDENLAEYDGIQRPLWFRKMWEKSMIIACNKGYL